jgi:surface antigen
MSRRAALSVGIGGTAIALLSAFPSTAQALTLPLYDSACPDPTGWSEARDEPHAGYYVIGNDEGLHANCTNYVAWVLMARGVAENSLKGLGDAKFWAANAQGKWTVNSSPAAGAIGQTTSGDHGHVAQVENVRGDGTLEITESNTVAGGHRRWLVRRIVAASYFNNFIHISDGNTTGSIEEDEEIMRLIKVSGTTTTYWVVGNGQFTTVSSSYFITLRDSAGFASSPTLDDTQWGRVRDTLEALGYTIVT